MPPMAARSRLRTALRVGRPAAGARHRRRLRHDPAGAQDGGRQIGLHPLHHRPGHGRGRLRGGRGLHRLLGRSATAAATTGCRPRLHGNTLVEIIWTAIPTVIVLVLFVLSALTLQQVEATSDPSAGGVNVEVDGFQWQWQFRYLDDDSNPDNDYSVIGSPASAAGHGGAGGRAGPPHAAFPRRDPLLLRAAVPHQARPDPLRRRAGRRTSWSSRSARRAPTRGQCAEFCGDLHAQMTFSVQAMSRAEYDKWLADAQGRRARRRHRAQPGGDVVDLSAAEHRLRQAELRVEADPPGSRCHRFTNQDAFAHDVGDRRRDNQELFNGEPFSGPDATDRLHRACDCRPASTPSTATIHPTR